MGQQTRHSRSAYGSLAHFSRECRAQHMPIHHCRARQPLSRRTTRHQLLSPHVCEHTHDTPDQAHVSIMTACSDAWLKARTVGGGARGVQREQRAHRHARCPLLPQPRPSGGKQTCARGSHSSSAVRWIRTGPSTGSGTDLAALPVATVARVLCDAEAWREPSRAVCSFSRKSKPETTPRGNVYSNYSMKMNSKAARQTETRRAHETGTICDMYESANPRHTRSHTQVDSQVTTQDTSQSDVSHVCG